MTFRTLPARLLCFLLLAALLPAPGIGAFDPDLEDGSNDKPLGQGENPLVPAENPLVPPEPRPQQKPVPFVENKPASLQTYLNGNRQPKFIRINSRGVKIRSSEEFSSTNNSNVTLKSDGGEFFAVQEVKKLERGASVRVTIDGEPRWVYVPNENTSDFHFCESEACFSVLSDALDFFLRGSSITNEEARSCGVTTGPEGLVLPPGAAPPRKEPPAPAPRPEPPKPAPRPAPPAPGPVTLRNRPLWEQAKGEQGKQWTAMMSESLDRYGRGLLNQKSLKDARTFCPNYSKLDEAGRKEFWIHLFSGIARYESNFKLGKPAFDEQTYTNVYSGKIQPSRYSMGLFQLSYSSAPGYRPGCRIDWNKDRGKDVSDPSLTIYDAKIQMDCAVTIMNRWVPRDGGVGLQSNNGGARFWSTLRSSNSATQNVIATLRRHTECWK